MADYLPAGGIVGAIGDMLTLIEELLGEKLNLLHAMPTPSKRRLKLLCVACKPSAHTRFSICFGCRRQPATAAGSHPLCAR